MPDCRILKAREKEDFLRALAFVLPHEKTCCALTRRILDRENGVYLIVHGGSMEQPVVDGVFFFRDDDILLPCLSGTRGCALKALAAFLEGKKLFCISALEGELAKVRGILSRLPKPPKICESRRYYFMEHRDRDAARRAIERLTGGIRIQVAGKADEAALLPLHFAYMREEVLIKGRKLNEEFERGQLREALGSQVIVTAVSGTETTESSAELRVVAKAGTNAIASKVMQLGGVYTVQEERGRGLATALTAFLAESAAQKGMATVLFVGKENPAAIAAYKRAGFVDSGKEYTIEYYD